MKIRTLVLTIAAVLAVPVSGHAAALSITNHSFEDPALPNGAGMTWQNDPAAWTAEGFADGGNTWAESNAAITVTTNADGLNSGGMQPGADGGYIYQMLGESFASNTTYTVNILAGNRADNQGTLGYGLMSSDALGTALGTIGSIAENTVPAGEWAEAPAYSFTTGGAAPAGNVVAFIQFVDATGGTRVIYDNIRVDATAVPEPSSALLALFGSALFLRRRR